MARGREKKTKVASANSSETAIYMFMRLMGSPQGREQAVGAGSTFAMWAPVVVVVRVLCPCVLAASVE